MFSVINTGKWLRDDEMDHAQGLLHQQYPDVDGLQSVLVFQTIKNIGTPLSPCVQVLLINNDHWICVSNIGCEPNRIRVFDSSINKSATPQMMKKLARLVMTEESKLVVEWPEFQVCWYSLFVYDFNIIT
jgi:hypothetical protein